MAKTIELALGGTLKLIAREIDEVQAVVTVTYERFQMTAKGDRMAYTLPGDKEVLVQVSYVDADGHPATVDGPVTWLSSDENIAIVIPQTDDKQAIIRPTDDIGNVQISVAADADLGSGVRQLVTLMDVTVVAGEAVAGTIQPVSEPTPIP